jgi:hypothetical protein
MPEINIRRRTHQISVMLHSATSLATTLDLAEFSGGVIDMGTVSTNASSLQMWVASSSAGEFRRLYKTDGSVADITLAPSTTAGRVYALPDEVFACPTLKVLSATTNSTGTVAMVTLKS